MKRELLHIIVLLMLVAGVNKAKAKTVDEIYWSEYAKTVEEVLTTDENNPKYVLLFDRGAALKGYVSRTDAFLSNGGNYGMQGILSNIGNRFYITKTVDDKGNGVYLIHSNTTNKVLAGLGNCLAIKDDERSIYMDRGNTYKTGTTDLGAPYWKFERHKCDVNNEDDWNKDEAGNKTEKICYYITNVNEVSFVDGTKGSGAGLYYDNIHKIISYSATEITEQWCIILEEDYRNAIRGLAQNSYVDVTGIIHDAGFNRFNDYETAWKVKNCNGNEVDIWDITPIKLNENYLSQGGNNEAKIEENNRRINEINALLAEVSSETIEKIKSLQAEIDKLQAEIDALNNGNKISDEDNSIINAAISELLLRTDLTTEERDNFILGLKKLMDERAAIIEGNGSGTILDKEAEILAYVNNMRPNGTEKIEKYDEVNGLWYGKINFIFSKYPGYGLTEEEITTKTAELEAEKSQKGIELNDLKENLPENYDELVAEKERLLKENETLQGASQAIGDKMRELLSYKSHVLGGWKMEKGVSETFGPDYWHFFQRYGKDLCAGIYACGEYSQTIENLPAGTYRIVCTGFNSGTNENNASLVINGNKVPMPLLGDMKGKLDEVKAEIKAYAKGEGAMGLTDDYYYQGLDIIAAAQLLDANRDRFTIDYYVEITGDQVKGGENKIVFGFSNNNQDDVAARDYPVFADNFQLMYTNMEYVAYISANNPKTEDIDRFAYERPVNLYVRRAFTPGWNSIVLPFDITVGGLAENFGNGAKLSKLMGINPERPSQIKFENTATLKAGECGLIYVPEDVTPYHANPNALTDLTVLKEPFVNGKFSTTNKQVYGPLYLIKGATRAGDEEGYTTVLPSIDALDYGTVSKSYKTQNTENGKEYVINFKGYYYKDGGAWPVHSYIVDHGHMYYLSSDWGQIYGTMWYLSDFEESSSAPSVRIFEINGVIDNTTTEIDSAVINNGNMASDKVYNINGQYMGIAASSDNLPKGIYIVNGKKLVIK